MGEGPGERRRDRRLLVLVVSAMTEDNPTQGIAARIAAQNDAFRRHILRGAPAGTPPGRVMVTRSVEAKGAAFRLAASARGRTPARARARARPWPARRA